MSKQNVQPEHKSIAVLTSGGDSPGMNAAVRAVVRTALNRGAEVYAVYEGYQGMVDGGDRIKKMDWDSVGGILQQGGTVIGSARCAAFRTKEGRLQAAKNLLLRHIDRLVVIGGDGSLTGANLFRQEWPSLVQTLIERGEVAEEMLDLHPVLHLVGLVGSIDNDMFGTDMTIGTDTALHRIIEAIDNINTTAASHQRTFVIEVMGRNCGYLALMSAIAAGANWVIIPENPPFGDNWTDEMCQALKAGRKIGRRNSIVIVAEGAINRRGAPITSEYVKQVLEDRIGEDTRVTILGHVQRGGSPSAFERNMSTLMGFAAADEILAATTDSEPQLIGLRQNKIQRSSLMACVHQTHQVAQAIADKNFKEAMALRGGNFAEAYAIFRTLIQAKPHHPPNTEKPLRLALMHCGGPAPGMNTAVRAAVRLGLDKGHQIVTIQDGFEGLLAGRFVPMDWMSVSGWMSKGGAELGTSRKTPTKAELPLVAEQLEAHGIDGLCIIGGWGGYETVYQMWQQRELYPAFNIPMVCLPTTINNNLPGSEHSIGADTALNSIVEAVDKIKQSAVATNRCFVVEVMGRDSGYLALISGLATGAERVYIPEEGVSLATLEEEVAELIKGFQSGKRLGLIIRSERADHLYTTGFMRSLFEKEGGDLFDVRQAILGHIQQGGNPSPYDRIQATRLAARCIDYLAAQSQEAQPGIAAIGLQGGQVQFTDLREFPNLIDGQYQRPKEQWWLRLREVAKVLDHPLSE